MPISSPSVQSVFTYIGLVALTLLSSSFLSRPSSHPTFPGRWLNVPYAGTWNYSSQAPKSLLYVLYTAICEKPFLPLSCYIDLWKACQNRSYALCAMAAFDLLTYTSLINQLITLHPICCRGTYNTWVIRGTSEGNPYSKNTKNKKQQSRAGLQHNGPAPGDEKPWGEKPMSHGALLKEA